MKFNFRNTEQQRKKKKTTFNDHKKLGYKPLAGFVGVLVCQIVLSFVMVDGCHRKDFKMSLLEDCINPSLSQACEIPLS